MASPFVNSPYNLRWGPPPPPSPPWYGVDPHNIGGIPPMLLPAQVAQNPAPVPQAININALPFENIPRNAENDLMKNRIEEGDVMANWFTANTKEGPKTERKFKRYYKKSTYNSLPTPKRHPSTRQLIDPTTVTYYKAHLIEPAAAAAATSGGRKRKTRRSKRRMNTTRRR
jgi:hypothetical protein